MQFSTCSSNLHPQPYEAETGMYMYTIVLAAAIGKWSAALVSAEGAAS
jgi:hypothetical protein